MEDNYAEELQLLEIMIKINKKVNAMCELFDGDVELFSDVMDDMDELLANLLIKKGIYIDLDYAFELVNGETTLNEIIQMSEEYGKEITLGNY